MGLQLLSEPSANLVSEQLDERYNSSNDKKYTANDTSIARKFQLKGIELGKDLVHLLFFPLDMLGDQNLDAGKSFVDFDFSV